MVADQAEAIQEGQRPTRTITANTTHALIDTGHLQRSLGAGSLDNINEIGGSISFTARMWSMPPFIRKGDDPSEESEEALCLSNSDGARTENYLHSQDQGNEDPRQAVLGLGEKLIEEIDGAIGVFLESVLFKVE